MKVLKIVLIASTLSPTMAFADARRATTADLAGKKFCMEQPADSKLTETIEFFESGRYRNEITSSHSRTHEGSWSVKDGVLITAADNARELSFPANIDEDRLILFSTNFPDMAVAVLCK